MEAHALRFPSSREEKRRVLSATAKNESCDTLTFLTIKDTLTTQESNLNISELFRPQTCHFPRQVPSPNRPRQLHFNYTRNDGRKGRVRCG